MTGPNAAAWAERLRAVAQGFDAFFRPIEPIFLATGDRLRDLHGRVAALAETAETAGSVLSSDEFAGMLADLATAAGQIDRLRAIRGGLTDALVDMVTTTDTMLKALDALARIVFNVQMLALNAKIEAAQLRDSGADFSVFTGEIHRLARTGDQTIGAVRREFAGLQGAAVQALALQRTFEETGLPELDAVAARLAASIQGLRDRQGRAAQGVRAIPGSLQALFARISNLVSDLQIYDMTCQRFDHVAQALTIAADMLEAPDSSGMDERQQQVFVNGIADLQSLQLIHAADGYHKAVVDVSRSLAAMADGAPAVGALCERTFDGGGLSLDEIATDLAKARTVFADFAAIRARATATVGQVVDAVSRAAALMRALNAVNNDLRLMGLNASIKCKNMGTQGRALNVIAQELQAYGRLTRGHVDTVAGNLSRIAEAAGAIGPADGAAGTNESDHLAAILEQAMARLRHTGEAVASLLGTIGTLGSAVVERTQVTDRGFTGRADCSTAITSAHATLRTLVAETDLGLSGPDLEAARREVLAFTEAHYTMASERTVHGHAVTSKEVVGLLTGTEYAAMDAGGTEDPDISDLLF